MKTDPPNKDFPIVWDALPIAGIILSGHNIQYANQEFFSLFECEDRHFLFENPFWMNRFFKGEQLRKFLDFIDSDSQNEIDVEIYTENRNYLYIVLRKRILRHIPRQSIVLFENLTVIHENTEAFKSSYDEFLNVTLELEDALKLIREQNAKLEHQRDILQTELRIAHYLQESLFRDDFSRYASMDMAGLYHPAQALGGDMWDIYEKNSHLFVVIGDVMGHGVASSLISVLAKGLFRKKFEEHCHGNDISVLPRILTELNDEILRITGRMFYITIAAIHIYHGRRLEYSTAGHPPILYISTDGKLRELSTDIPMLGILDPLEPYSGYCDLHKGDTLFLYTDGLVENGFNLKPAIRIDQIIEILRSGQSGQQILDTLFALRTSKPNPQELHDDLAMIYMSAR